jgi:outer membrane lipoprotein-sorting protein
MRLTTLVVMMLVAAPAYGQENDAEKLYRAMEKKVQSAKVVHVVCDGQVNTMDMKSTMKGDVRLAEGDKVKMLLEGDVGGKATKWTRISDGKKVYSSVNDRVVVTDVKPSDKKMEQSLAIIGRMGVLAAFKGVAKDPNQAFDVDKVAPVKDFKLGAKDKIGKQVTQVVEYQVTVPDVPAAKISVWIDTATYLPVKREMVSQRKDGQELRISETYTTFTVDAKIDAKEFELPK